MLLRYSPLVMIPITKNIYNIDSILSNNATIDIYFHKIQSVLQSQMSRLVTLRTLEKSFPKFFLSGELIGPLAVCRGLKSVTGCFLVKSVSLGKYISTAYVYICY